MLLFPATSTTYNVPFLEKFQPPATLHFVQENDPKYTLHTVQIFIQSDVSINWWHSSTVLPDVNCKVAGSIVRLLVATLHVGMTGKQDSGYTQLT